MSALSALGGAATLALAVFAVISYQQIDHHQRVDRSIEQVRGLQSPLSWNDRFALDDAIARLPVPVDEVARQGDEFLAIVATALVEGQSDEVTATRRALVRLISEFDTAGACAARGACDGETLRELIGSEIVNVRCQWAGAIEALRRNGYRELGQDMAGIAAADDCSLADAGDR